MIAVITAQVWGKAPSDYLFGDPLILAIDYECAKLKAEAEKEQTEKSNMIQYEKGGP